MAPVAQGSFATSSAALIRSMTSLSRGRLLMTMPPSVWRAFKILASLTPKGDSRLAQKVMKLASSELSLMVVASAVRLGRMAFW